MDKITDMLAKTISKDRGVSTLAELVEAICDETSWIKGPLTRKGLTHKDVEAIYSIRLDHIKQTDFLEKLTESNFKRVIECAKPWFEEEPQLICEAEGMYPLGGPYDLGCANSVVYTKDWIISNSYTEDEFANNTRIIPRATGALPDRIELEP